MYIQYTLLYTIDLNTDELLAKRANIQRIKEFSKSLQTYNKNATQHITNNKKGLSGAEAKEIEISQKYQESKCTYI